MSHSHSPADANIRLPAPASGTLRVGPRLGYAIAAATSIAIWAGVLHIASILLR